MSFATLPAELILEIALCLSVVDYTRLFSLCKYIKAVLDSSRAWRAVIKRDFIWYSGHNGLSYQDIMQRRMKSIRELERSRNVQVISHENTTNRFSHPKRPLEWQKGVAIYLRDSLIPSLLFPQTCSCNSTVLVTGKPGMGKSELIRHCGETTLSKKITWIFIYARSVRVMGNDEIERIFKLIYSISPAILVLEELESLSRQEIKSQRSLIDFITQNSKKHGGLGIVCVSQAPGRLIGQYPANNWTFLECSHVTQIELLIRSTRDYEDLWQYIATQLNGYDFLSAEELQKIAIASMKDSPSFSDVLTTLREWHMRVTLGQHLGLQMR